MFEPVWLFNSSGVGIKCLSFSVTLQLDVLFLYVLDGLTSNYKVAEKKYDTYPQPPVCLLLLLRTFQFVPPDTKIYKIEISILISTHSEKYPCKS